jgi:DNA-binding transcriptional regulator YbjK
MYHFAEARSMVTMRGSSQERSRIRRVALLDSAIEVITEQGVRGITHRAVSLRAGLPPATAGYYFETSAELIEAALLQHVQARTGLLGDLLRRNAASAEGLLDLARRIARSLVTGESGVTTAQYEVYLESSRRPALQAAVAESMEGFIGATAPLLASLGVADPHQGARALVALTNGLALQRFANPLPLEEDVELTAQSIVGLFAAYALGPDRLVELLEIERQG